MHTILDAHQLVSSNATINPFASSNQPEACIAPESLSSGIA
jgi:hypothetical protein